MKIIFLDIDGVLNGMSTLHANIHLREKQRDDIDITCLGMLAEIVNATGARIVISSSWRVGGSDGQSRAYWSGYFRGLGWAVDPITIFGETPRGKSRGAEIMTWLKEYRHQFCDWKFENYIILDDETFDFYEKGFKEENIVYTDVCEGLTYRKAQEAIKKLGAIDPDYNFGLGHPFKRDIAIHGEDNRNFS